MQNRCGNGRCLCAESDIPQEVRLTCHMVFALWGFNSTFQIFLQESNSFFSFNYFFMAPLFPHSPTCFIFRIYRISVEETPSTKIRINSTLRSTLSTSRSSISPCGSMDYSCHRGDWEVSCGKCYQCLQKYTGEKHIHISNVCPRDHRQENSSYCSCKIEYLHSMRNVPFETHLQPIPEHKCSACAYMIQVKVC
jgi:hypothetical protein